MSSQPMCIACYRALIGELPHDPVDVDRCCQCGNQTLHAVYVNLNPDVVRYPKDKPA